MLTIIDPGKHVVKDTPTARIFRRLLGFEDIFTFWHGELGEWILAYWVDERRRLCDEMEDLGMGFEKVTPELVQMIVTCWKPINWKAKKVRLISKEKDRVRKEVEKIQEEQSRWDWAKKRMTVRGLKPVPYAFASPVSGGQVQ
jgi:hypothetical protein